MKPQGRNWKSTGRQFEKLSADEDGYLALAQAVFAEECFAPLRFTASDVQGAFDHVGYPAIMSPDERTVEILRAAILHAADKERRGQLAMSLLLRLPQFVTAGRYLEAWWLLQCSAIETVEHDGESNAFLFQMFRWLERLRRLGRRQTGEGRIAAS